MHIKLFSCCVLTKGVNRASIVDIQREQIFFIPLSLYNLIDTATDSIDLLKIGEELDENSSAVFDEYILFLTDNELAFYCDKDDLATFPKMSDEYLFPAYISNCLIDSNGDNLLSFDKSFFSQLSSLCCRHLQLRLYSVVDFKCLDEFLNLINDNEIKSVEIIIPADDFLTDEQNIVNILEQNRKLRNLVITSSESCKVINADRFSGTAIMTDQKIDNNSHCGIVQLTHFAINNTHYTESLQFNSCLNRKLSIDIKGEIKNCPSMKQSFGNIKDTLLEAAAADPEFTKYWNINKDSIAKCRDCEFRYICTDCRAFTDDPEDIYSAPLKCGYNPYNCIWEEWTANPLKEKGIAFYGLQHLTQVPRL